MKVEYNYWSSNKKRGIFGIMLIAETDTDIKIIERFHDGGIKKNGTNIGRSWMAISFADLIGKDLDEVEGV